MNVMKVGEFGQDDLTDSEKTIQANECFKVY